MRSVVIGVAVALLSASIADAQVQLSTQRDGTKVISNFGVHVKDGKAALKANPIKE